MYPVGVDEDGNLLPTEEDVKVSARLVVLSMGPYATLG